MINILKPSLITGVFLLLCSCAAFSSSMTPGEVNDTLPPLTKSRYMSQAQAQEAIKTNSFQYLVKGRKYTAPIGITVKQDLDNGARGIDEWVELDGEMLMYLPITSG